MKYIKKIEINYFRSLKKVTLNKIEDLSIISGANDTGKSNVLDALSLFFKEDNCNFEIDYNKKRKDEAIGTKAKQSIRIGITFAMPSQSSVLPAHVYVSKT